MTEPTDEPVSESVDESPEGARSGILGSSAVMAAGTVVSRLSGFARTGLLIAALGNGLRGDVFNVANTIPNMLYILLAGGIFNAVLVPQLVRAGKNDPDGGAAYTDRIITLAGIFLAVASVFAAQAAGVEMTLGQQLVMMLTLMVTSKGVAAVPRASLVILAGTLASFGLPLEAVAVILGVDELMDMARTTVNLVGNCLATCVMARWEGEFDDAATGVLPEEAEEKRNADGADATPRMNADGRQDIKSEFDPR